MLDYPRPFGGEILMGGEKSLDPAEDLRIAQLKRGGSVGVTTEAHMAQLVSAPLKGRDSVAHECDHGILVAQSELLQLREPLVNLVVQSGRLLGDLLPEFRVRWTRSVGQQLNQIFGARIPDIEEGPGPSFAGVKPGNPGENGKSPGRDGGSSELGELLILRIYVDIGDDVATKAEEPNPQLLRGP